MKRTATLDLDGFDPDVLDAAREVAERAGVPVEAWIASIVAPEPGGQTRRRRAPAGGRRRTPAATADPAPPHDGAEPAAAAPDPAAPFTASIAEMLRRLDSIDHKIAQDHQASQTAATKAIEGIEARISTALDAGLSPAAQMAERLGDIERRMTELGEQLAAPRPLGRRGRPVVAEIRDAVAEIRQRQQELDAQGRGPAADASDAAAAKSAPAKAPSPAITELQLETSRLRESIGGLATGRDVGALEQAMRALVTGVQRAQEPADLAAIAAPIELIRVQVARLAEDVAENVHARVVNDVERLAAKVDGALTGSPAGFADRDALGDLFRELDEIRRLIASLAGPERIQSLAQGLQAISGQISQLQGGVASDGANMAELRPLLEEIRSGLRAPASGGIEEQIQAMDAKLDALRDGASRSGGEQSDAIIGRIDALADKVDRVSVNPVGDLIGRLEDLGETLRRPVVPGGDLASIHGLLHDLADKLDRVGNSANPRGEGLDALEKQVLALASRIDTRDADPALAGLERTMSALLAQVSALREEAPIEAAVERAARNAVAGTVGTMGESGEIGLLRASLADLRAHQAASEHRMQATLEGVHTALERLVGRLGTLDVGGLPPTDRRPAQDGLADRLMSATAIPAVAVMPAAAPGQAGAEPHAPSGRRPEMPRAGKPAQTAIHALDLSRVSDEPLEPGAGRPGREPVAAVTAEPAPADGDIKTSFIAAARRAAQAAQAEAAGKSPTPEPRAQRSAGAKSGTALAGRTARLRAELDRRRKPLLLGLAAIVLALGALQVVGSKPAYVEADTTAQVAEITPQEIQAPVPAPVPAGETAAASKAAEPKAAELTMPALSRLDPATTQSIADPAPPVAGPEAAPQKPAVAAPRSVVPHVPDLSGLAGDLAAVPTGFAKLRQSAIEGDGASVYELAARAAEGRGMPRDYAIAAKLFEKLAFTGYAPAQYKLGGLYEKGSGVVRDIAQAKTWYGRGADQGHARAMHNLAVVLAENPAASGKPDFTNAAQWFRRGAEYGIRDSQYNLAVLSTRGLGLPQDLVQSYLWFSAAAAQGDDDAGRKRDDVAAKLNPKDLATARALSAAFKPKVAEPAVNEPPAATAPGGAMTLLGAPPPSPAAPAGRRG